MKNVTTEFLYFSTLLTSAVAAFVYRKHLETRKILIILPYLFLVFIQELITGFYYFDNSIVYNIYRPVTTIVFAIIYYRIPFMQPVRKFIAGITILYLAITIANYCFFESIFTAGSYLILARSFVVTLFAIIFLFRYFNLDNSTEEKYWRPLVWITAGIIIFYPVTSLSLSFQKFLSEKNATLFDQKLYQLIPQVMSIFMYSFFSYAFYLCHKIKRPLSFQ